MFIIQILKYVAIITTVKRISYRNDQEWKLVKEIISLKNSMKDLIA